MCAKVGRLTQVSASRISTQHSRLRSRAGYRARQRYQWVGRRRALTFPTFLARCPEPLKNLAIRHLGAKSQGDAPSLPDGLTGDRAHARARGRAEKDAGTGIPAAYGPLLELCRALSRQMDTASVEGPSSRLSAAYLSALKDLSKILVAAPTEAKELDPLERFRADHLRPIPSTKRR